MRIWLGLFIAIALIGIAWFIFDHRVKDAPLAVTPPAQFASLAPACPKLANPCERVNCNRVNTKVIE